MGAQAILSRAQRVVSGQARFPMTHALSAACVVASALSFALAAPSAFLSQSAQTRNLEAEYTTGKTGVNGCPPGYEEITAHDECEKASIALALEYDPSQNNVRGLKLQHAVCNHCGGCQSSTTRVDDTHFSKANYICKKTVDDRLLVPLEPEIFNKEMTSMCGDLSQYTPDRIADLKVAEDVDRDSVMVALANGMFGGSSENRNCGAWCLYDVDFTAGKVWGGVQGRWANGKAWIWNDQQKQWQNNDCYYCHCWNDATAPEREYAAQRSNELLR